MQAETAALDCEVIESLREPALTDVPVPPGSMDDQVLAFPDRKPPLKWYLALCVTLSALGVGVASIGWTFYKGIGA